LGHLNSASGFFCVLMKLCFSTEVCTFIMYCNYYCSSGI
jgi:hypothetical protein